METSNTSFAETSVEGEIYTSASELLQVFTENGGRVHASQDEEVADAVQVTVASGGVESLDNQFMFAYTTHNDIERRCVIVDPSTGVRAYDVACRAYDRKVRLQPKALLIFPEDGVVLDENGFRSDLSVDAQVSGVADAQDETSAVKKKSGMHIVAKKVEEKTLDTLNGILRTGDTHQQRSWETRLEWWLRERNGKNGLPEIHWFAVSDSDITPEAEECLRKLKGGDERAKMIVKIARAEKRAEQRGRLAQRIKGLIGRKNEIDV